MIFDRLQIPKTPFSASSALERQNKDANYIQARLSSNRLPDNQIFANFRPEIPTQQTHSQQPLQQEIPEIPTVPTPPNPILQQTKPFVDLPNPTNNLSNQELQQELPNLTLPEKFSQFPTMSQLPRPQLVPDKNLLEDFKARLTEARNLRESLASEGVDKVVPDHLAEDFFSS
jgi:hypothetical protein